MFHFATISGGFALGLPKRLGRWVLLLQYHSQCLLILGMFRDYGGGLERYLLGWAFYLIPPTIVRGLRTSSPEIEF